MDVKSYSMLLHLSQFAYLILPVAGILLPIIMWAVNKDKDTFIEENGRVVINWMISLFIYCFVSGLLLYFKIGIILLIGVLICNIIFIVIGAAKANSGQVWEYPLSIRFMII